MPTKKNVRRTTGLAKRGRRPAPRPKGRPEVSVVEMKDGRIRIINGTQAAEFVGVSQQAFAAVIRRYYAEMRRPKKESRFECAKRRVVAAYPELFK